MFALFTELKKWLKKTQRLSCRLCAIKEILEQNGLTTSTTTTSTTTSTTTTSTTTSTSTTTTTSSTTTTTTEAPLEMLDFSGISDIYAYGDSYTNPGLQATGGGTPAANSYLPKLLATIGKGVTNRGATGTGILTAVNASLVNDVQPRTRAITCMIGLNDGNVNGNDSDFLAHFKDIYRVFAVSNLITSGTAAGDLTTPSWFGYDHASGYHKAHQFGAGKKPMLTQTLYSGTQELTYNFTNDHVVMQYFTSMLTNSASYTYLDTMQIRIDGVLVDTIDCHNPVYAQAYPGWEVFSDYFPKCKIYSGLTNAAHTIGIRRTAVSSASGGILIDYFGHLGTDTSDTNPILLGHATYITNYAQAPPANNGSDAVIDDVNQQIDDIISEIKAVRPDLPILAMRTNEDSPALVGGDYHADGLHWNDSGHDKGYQKFLNRISAF